VPKLSDFEQFVNQYGPELGRRRQLTTRPKSIGSTTARLRRGRSRVWVFGGAKYFFLLHTALMGCRPHHLFGEYRRVKLPRRGLGDPPHLMPRLRMSVCSFMVWTGPAVPLPNKRDRSVLCVGHGVFCWSMKWVWNWCVEIWYFWKFISSRINLLSV
jgi:hypothetical protein